MPNNIEVRFSQGKATVVEGEEKKGVFIGTYPTKEEAEEAAYLASQLFIEIKDVEEVASLMKRVAAGEEVFF
jgi:hypothetical protein